MSAKYAKKPLSCSFTSLGVLGVLGVLAVRFFYVAKITIILCSAIERYGILSIDHIPNYQPA